MTKLSVYDFDKTIYNGETLNDFYRLKLKEEIDKKYNFDITSLEGYKKGIERR